MKINTDLTYDEVSRIFAYNPCTGIITRKRDGKVVGSPVHGSHSYSHVSVGKKIYMCHRIGWLLTYGNWPKLYLDHIDGDTKNNSIWNLREANGGQNRTNSTTKKNSKRPYRGVEVRNYKGRIKFHACIQHNGKRVLVGRYDSAEEAKAAYDAAAKELHGVFRRAA